VADRTAIQSVSGETWDAWLADHGPALLLLARQWTDCRASAEDLVQEAFVRFWRTRDRAADPVAYLFGCLRGCGLERLRGERRRRDREASVALPPDAPDEDTCFRPSAIMERDERQRLVEEALRGLPPEQREVVTMKLWGRLSFPQIAAAVGIPADTAASRYRYALAKLREQLAEEPSR
jgi:RNA polymerase sigma-70 factor (ECF subfamily)